MTNIDGNFVIGVCTRHQGLSAMVSVRADVSAGHITDLNGSTHKRFPPIGEIELKAAKSFIDVNDWVAAHPTLEGPPRRQKFVSTINTQMIPFEDLHEFYAPEAARRMLVETGRQDGFEGLKAFRIDVASVVRVRMTKGADGRCRATAADMTHLPVYRYDETKRLRIPTSIHNSDLIMVDQEPSVSIINWGTDIEFIGTILKAAAEQGDDNQQMAALADFLSGYGRAIGATLDQAASLDGNIGREIMRSRHLGSLLKERASLIDDFMTLMKSDKNLKAHLDTEIERTIKEFTAARSAEISARLEGELRTELAARREKLMAELQQEVKDLEASSLSDLERRISEAERNATETLGARRQTLQDEVTRLEDSVFKLEDERSSLVANSNALSGEATRLESEIASRKEDIDRLLRLEAVLNGAATNGSAKDRAPIQIPGREIGTSDCPSMTLDQASKWIETCKLLKQSGRLSFRRFSAALIGGLIPVIRNADSDDVIDVTARMVSGGRVVFFDCDETVISYDDLWVRPGGVVKTPLGAAYERALASPGIVFCVIRRADLSETKYWIEPLASAARRGILPENLLIAISLDDPQSPRSETLLTHLQLFEVSGVVEGTAGLILTGDHATQYNHVIEIQESDPAALVDVAVKLATGGVTLRISDVPLLGRLNAAARLLPADDIIDFMKRELSPPSATPAAKGEKNR